MTKIALPVWNERVSPAFDAATTVLIAEFDRARIGSRYKLSLKIPEARAAQLEALGVQILICGGISTPLLRDLAGRGIRVLCHVCGPTDEVLRGFSEDRLQEERFKMPGCHCKRHECRRRSARQI